MFGSEILEVAIGLVFVFLIASLLATAVREGIEQILKTRAIHLEKGIRQLLDDPDGTTATKALFDHPQILGLFRGDYLPDDLVGKAGALRTRMRSTLPAYIPSRNFALALLHNAAGARDGAALTLENVKAGVAALPDGHLRRALETAIGEAQGDLERARASLEAWFDSGMDRVSGWYKRESQWILFALGLVLAAALNINALTVLHDLARDNALRQATVARAGEVTAKLREADKLPAGAQAPPQADADADNPPGLTPAELKVQVEGLSSLIGDKAFAHHQQAFVQSRADDAYAKAFHGKPVDARVRKTWFADWREHQAAGWEWLWWGIALVGWLITATAISIGAPFWFDLLNKLMVIRSTVKPNEKSPPEGSKDRAGGKAPAADAAPPPQPVLVLDAGGGADPVEPPSVTLRLAVDTANLDPGTLTVQQNGGTPQPVAPDGFVELPLAVGAANQIDVKAKAGGKAVAWSDTLFPNLNQEGHGLLATLK